MFVSPIRAACATVAATLLALPAAAQNSLRPDAPPRYYGGAHIGQNNLSSWPATVDFGGPTTEGSLKLDHGLHFGVIAGRQEGPNRLEIEYQRGRVSVTDVGLGPVTQTNAGKGHYDTFTLGAYRVVEIQPGFNFFGGLGIGWGRVQLPQLAAVGTCNCFREAEESGFVWQLRVGAEYDVAPDSTLFAQYTWLRLPQPSSGGSPGINYGSKTVGVWGVGFRSNF